MRDNLQNKTNVNLYFIKSDFKEILIKLCKKILEEKQQSLINLNKDLDLHEIDEYLWVKEKNDFIPHKIFDERLSELDNLVLFEGPHERMKKLREFKQIIVSPNVKISKFTVFEKFMLFSNQILNGEALQILKNKFLINKINYKIFYEYSSFKWKLVK